MKPFYQTKILACALFFPHGEADETMEKAHRFLGDHGDVHRDRFLEEALVVKLKGTHTRSRLWLAGFWLVHEYGIKSGQLSFYSEKDFKARYRPAKTDEPHAAPGFDQSGWPLPSEP